MFGYTGSSLLSGLSLVSASRGSTLVVVPVLLIVEASLVAEQGSGVREPQHLQHSGSRALAQQLWCTCLAALRDLPGPGIEPVSPALAG